MSTGANSIHRQLRTELEDYIKSQYFGNSPLLLSAISSKLDEEGMLYQKPFIESSPAYKTRKDGIQQSSLPDWIKDYFTKLSAAGVGVYPSPFVHQIEALEAATDGKDLFVATGTGSGKTECFMWPLMEKLASEARDSGTTWDMRGIRTIIMYPMNALVSDQISRLRRLIGDPENKFVHIFREVCGAQVRRPQFGMYTGRTPYPGAQPDSQQDHHLVRTLAKMTFPESESQKAFFNRLVKEGKIPAKADMNAFLERLKNSEHIPNEEDAELITRFEMQQFCPDILITNYSMLEYMLLRQREAKIWSDTKAWLEADPYNKLLFIIDEAHMYRGSSGGEVALLIRRLFHRLGISRECVQFILTTASMPNGCPEDQTAVKNFARTLTAASPDFDFCYITGEREELEGKLKFDIPLTKFEAANVDAFEDTEDARLAALNQFWIGVEGAPAPFADLDTAYSWMYNNLIFYRPFYEMIKQCRGNAISLHELSASIFPGIEGEKALQAISVLLAIAPLAKSSKGAILFPARMHMLFRGIKGVYACANENCSHSHTDGSLTLGEIFLSDGRLICPCCHSVVYELYNDRRCGALFYKGYILDSGKGQKSTYLWHYPGQLMDRQMKEIHLYLPPVDFDSPFKRGKSAIKPCYLDIKSGFINFGDDSQAGKANMRKLYWCDYTAKGRPQVITFEKCPHCRHKLSSTQLTSFSTRGNQPFFSLIQAQFQSQPAVPGKDKDPVHLPNQGRKVLLFSDSRQRAARLARDMSDTSDVEAARRLFVLAIDCMEKSTSEQSRIMNYLYDYVCLVAGQQNVQLFHGDTRKKFADNCASVLRSYALCTRQKRNYLPQLTIANAPLGMQEYLLRLFSGGYNTLYDSATSWIEPSEQALFGALDCLEGNDIEISEEEFLEVFNAWIISICDTATALGHTISDDIRKKVRHSYGGYGLGNDWDFSKEIRSCMGWEDQSTAADVWRRVLKEFFLDVSQHGNGKLYVDLSRIKPRADSKHAWYRCEQCTEITPFLLRGKCPSCAASLIHKMTEEEYAALSFWRTPIAEARCGKPIHVIDTEEHTAQLSHKDQRDNLWSKTEEYELRFQDLIEEKETPVDILSSTTTMEVGIDIGSLVAVGLRNIPPMRENYQQRAGRAGRRGSSLSTIVTFCEDGPHDTLYFNDPVPMFRGDPRRPWIDIDSPKLLQRHLSIVALQEFLSSKGKSMDCLPAADFLDTLLDDFSAFTAGYKVSIGDSLLPLEAVLDSSTFASELCTALGSLKEKRDAHPELFGAGDEARLENAKSLLDALYEDGIIPTYSFPKNVVSTYISDNKGKLAYTVERGLDVAIGEYAPGRAIVVDKKTYQIGGLYYPGSERRHGSILTPARTYVDDPNYLKSILSCEKCGWFGLKEEMFTTCPFCGSHALTEGRQMLRPWGFAPRDADSIEEAQLSEEYSYPQQPLYSTLPDSDEIHPLLHYDHIRMAKRSNQRIIMVNKGTGNKGFMVCPDCGAAIPGEDPKALDNILRPYKSPYARAECKHKNAINVDLGYDFITDMLVLEFALDDRKINADPVKNPWISRSAQSLAEAFRLAASKELDVEFTELVTGYRLRRNDNGCFVDIYLYDSLSSGAGYAVTVADQIEKILEQSRQLLQGCDCDAACYKCLKHYRNQHIHGMLDRFAALELLDWGQKGVVAKDIPMEEQAQLIAPLSGMLSASECRISYPRKTIVISRQDQQKTLVVYPAMWVEPSGSDLIFMSNAYLKYAKPYALQKIIDSFFEL